MIPKLAIEKAISGGWKPRGRDDVYLASFVQFGWSFNHKDTVPLHAFWTLDYEIALDPTFWQALAKSLGWGETEIFRWDGERMLTMYWAHQAHLFYDLILRGYSTEAFWQELLQGN